jgi:hypothetical protein
MVYLPVSGAVVFDEWRHTFFVYPAFVGLALVGLVVPWRFIRGRFEGPRQTALSVVLTVAVTFGIAASIRSMARNHPFQHVYFNALVGGIRGANGRFDLDYWGLSYRRALEYVLDEDSSQVVTVSVYSRPGKSNADILPESDRKRLRFIDDPYRATYFLSHERWNRLRYPPEEEFYTVRVDGVRIMLVLKETTADSVVTILGRSREP